MSKHDNRQTAEDLELTRLFSSMDEITASQELRDKTLAAIFTQLDDEESRPPENTGPRLSLVQNTPSVAKAGRRSRGWSLKVAAAIVAATIVVGGSTAYALPASHVQVTVDETTFDLGVNIFGTTVTATADNDDGKAVIDQSDVHNRAFRDALNRILDAYEKSRNATTETVHVQVNEQFGGGGKQLDEDAKGTIEQRKERHATEQPQQTESAPTPTPTPMTVSAEPAQPATPTEFAPDQRQAEPMETPRAEDSPQSIEGEISFSEPTANQEELQQGPTGGPQEQGGMPQDMGGGPPR